MMGYCLTHWCGQAYGGQGGSTMTAPTIAALQAEIVSLQQQQTVLEASLQATELRAQQYDVLFQHIPISIAVWSLDRPDDPRSFRLTAANAHNQLTAGFDLKSQVGRQLVEIFPGV